MTQNDNNSRYYCSHLLKTLGMFEYVDSISGDSVVSIFFPQDTRNEFSDYTLVHELTHRDLVQGSLLGNLQLLLSASKEIPSYADEHRQAITDALMFSVNNSRQLQEAIATYIGFIHQSTTNPAGVKKIYQKLPSYYRSALSLLETICPEHEMLVRGQAHQYRNILLALGKFSLNTPVIYKLLEETEVSVERLQAIIQEDSADRIFHSLIQRIQHEPSIMTDLLDIVRQTAINSGFDSFDCFYEAERPRESVVVFLNQLDQRLMDKMAATFSVTGNVTLSLNQRGELMNRFLEKWNSSFQQKYGHQFTSFQRFETDPDPKARIRTVPAAPEAASGERTNSKIPAPVIRLFDIIGGFSVAKTQGLWFHIRMFINPGDEQLSLGPAALPLSARSSLLVFAPCVPDSIKTENELNQFITWRKHLPSFCWMQTCYYLPNSHIPSILEYSQGVTILWHIDWIMYNYAKRAGIEVDSFHGYKYIHMDNADDLTFFELLKNTGKKSQVEGYVQKFGQETLLVATFYRSGTDIFYSIPIQKYKYDEFIQALESVHGHLLQNDEFSTKPFRYRNNMALLYHYGI